MRILECYIENIRVHKELLIQFDDGLTLIEGKNESGKSTIVEGMHKALFLKANATGDAVEALRNTQVFHLSG